MTCTDEDYQKIKNIAIKVNRKFHYLFDLDDLTQEGAVAFLRGLSRYDSDKNDTYWGYIYKRVYGSMLDYIDAKLKKTSKEVLTSSTHTMDIHHKEPVTINWILPPRHVEVTLDKMTTLEYSILYDYLIAGHLKKDIAVNHNLVAVNYTRLKNIVQTLTRYIAYELYDK